MTNSIELTIGKYTNKDGEEKQFLAIVHPDHPSKIRLLNKKKDDGSDQRLDNEEMIAYLKGMDTPWRDHLEYVVNTKNDWGDYFVISGVSYETVDI
jgi:hypothetical protein